MLCVKKKTSVEYALSVNAQMNLKKYDCRATRIELDTGRYNVEIVSQSSRYIINQSSEKYQE